MSARSLFLDTNVVVYLFDTDSPAKRATARGLLRERADVRISTQVLQEFYVAVTRKFARPMDPEKALVAVRELQSYHVAVITPSLVSTAARRSIDSKISFWDALIVETALAQGVDVLVTEDLQDGWMVGAMRIWNPFKD